jgi:lipopolysaccharide assembly outer membrane protein LptD (OstA)
LANSNNITITSDFGKYNTINYDTIFSKNVIIDYTDNKITGEYLDFSIDRGSIIVSNNVIFTNSENILKTDSIEVDINTKDTKIYMYNSNDKVNIKSKN